MWCDGVVIVLSYSWCGVTPHDIFDAGVTTCSLANSARVESRNRTPWPKHMHVKTS